MAIALLGIPVAARGESALLIGFSYVILAGVFAYYSGSLARRRRTEEVVAPEWPPAGCRWLDLYASHDPVPNGHLSAEFPLAEPQRVTNYASAISDHTTYARNLHQFVGPLLAAIGAQSGAGWIDKLKSGDKELLERGAKKRNRLVRYLVTVRFVLALGVVWNLYVFEAWLRKLGEWTLPLWQKLPLVGVWGGARLQGLLWLVFLAGAIYWVYLQIWEFALRADLARLWARSYQGWLRTEGALILAAGWIAWIAWASPFPPDLKEEFGVYAFAFIGVPFITAVLSFFAQNKNKLKR